MGSGISPLPYFNGRIVNGLRLLYLVSAKMQGPERDLRQFLPKVT
jgi:hypothetical protein